MKNSELQIFTMAYFIPKQQEILRQKINDQLKKA